MLSKQEERKLETTKPPESQRTAVTCFLVFQTLQRALQPCPRGLAHVLVLKKESVIEQGIYLTFFSRDQLSPCFRKSNC